MPNPLALPGSEQAWRDSHQLAADAAKSNAAGIVGTALALGGSYGALRGLYESYNRRKQLEKQQKALQFEPSAVPLVTGKSASLLKRSNFALGDQAHSYGAMAVPWLGPGVVAALFGGHALGKGLVNSTTDQNIAEDLKAEREKKKQQYLQAAQSAAHPAPAPAQPDTLPMVAKAAADFAPSGIDRWGPELGVGTSLVGGLGLASMLRQYNISRNQAKQKEIEERDKATQRELATLRPELHPVPTPPVSFTG